MDQDLDQNEQMTWFLLVHAVEHPCTAQNELERPLGAAAGAPELPAAGATDCGD